MVAVFGHRGARGLLPENTLPGFTRARELGLTGVEFDVGMTADGVAIVHHDPRLNPDIARTHRGDYVESGEALIHGLTYQQLLTYDVGRLRAGSAYAARFSTQKPQDGLQVPTLDEVLATCAGLDVLVEVKTSPDKPEDTASPRALVQATIECLQAHHLLDKAVLYAFDWRVLDEAAILAPNLRRCCLMETATVENAAVWFGKADLTSYQLDQPGSLPRIVASTGAKVWAPDFKMLSKQDIELAHHLGLTIIPWTVNEPDDIRNMLDLGVDGLISDWPDRVLDILSARGLASAAPGFIARTCGF